MSKSTVLSRFNSSVNEAVKDGRLDRKKHGALIEAARKLAATMRFDNVTPSTYKQYCEMLHLTPSPKMTEVKKINKNLVGNSKWKRA